MHYSVRTFLLLLLREEPWTNEKKIHQYPEGDLYVLPVMGLAHDCGISISSPNELYAHAVMGNLSTWFTIYALIDLRALPTLLSSDSLF